jgi:hypothetical protein
MRGEESLSSQESLALPAMRFSAGYLSARCPMSGRKIIDQISDVLRLLFRTARSNVRSRFLQRKACMMGIIRPQLQSAYVRLKKLNARGVVIGGFRFIRGPC